MLSLYWHELIRSLQEYTHFKVNLLFANLELLVTFFTCINYFISPRDASTLYILLICWYVSSHSFTHPSYFVEDEFLDATIVQSSASKNSLFRIICLRSFVQLTLDVIKGIPLFILLGLVIQVHIDASFFIYVVVAIAVALGLYGLGILFSAVALITHKASNVASLISYFILFFGGIIAPSSISLCNYILPFNVLSSLITTPTFTAVFVLFIQALIYWTLGWLTFTLAFARAKRSGGLFYV